MVENCHVYDLTSTSEQLILRANNYPWYTPSGGLPLGQLLKVWDNYLLTIYFHDNYP